MKKLSILLSVFLFLLTGCTKETKTTNLLDDIKAKEKIVVGIKNDSKPFGFIKDGKFQGFDIDIAKEISKEIFSSNDEKYIEFIPLNASERISALNTGKVDILVATLSMNKSREAIIDFSNPYFVAGQTLMVAKNSYIGSIEQLNNKNVAVVLGTTGEKTLRTLAPVANSVGAFNYHEAFNMLKKGQVEAILADDSLLYGILSENKNYKILNSRYTEEYYAVGIRKCPENKELKKQINQTIRKIQENGRMAQIKSKWIPKNKIK